MSATLQLAEFAAGLHFGDLPPEVVTLAKQLTLDSLGTAYAASAFGAGCAQVVSVAEALGGPAESTIIGSGTKVAASNAAFANGALVHALNYDAYGAETGHTGVACLASVLALAEARACVSGARFLVAVVIAAEITARLTAAGREITRPPHQLSGQYDSYFGAAAGAGSIAGLGSSAMESAFGLALMQVAGSRQIVIGGDIPAKAIYGAFPAQSAVMAVLLAEAGLRADVDAIGGVAGFYAGSAGGTFEFDRLVRDLGQVYACTKVGFKPWPVSAHVMPFVEAALAVRAQIASRADDISAVTVLVHPSIRDWVEPLVERRRPANPASAANSVIFATAKALVHGKLTLGDFTELGMRDDATDALAQRTTYRLDPAVDGGVVTVTLTDGRRLEVAVGCPLGDATRPMTQAQLEAKFRDCCSYASLAPAKIEALIEAVNTLDDAAGISALII